jgi:glycosyltransferase involved in cell wall biosynthesis
VIRILTLSTLFPNPVQSGLGNNVWRQVKRVHGLPDVEVTVIAPVPRFALPLPIPGMPYSELRAVPAQRTEGGILIHHPRYAALPKVGWRMVGNSIASAAVPLALQLHRNEPFDLITSEFFFPDAEAVLQAARSLHIPHVMKARGSDIRFWAKKRRPRRQMVGAARYAASLLAVSDALRSEMVLMGLPRERVAVHYTGVDLTAFSAGVAPRARNHLVTVGNLVPLKRQSLVVQAMKHLPDFTLEVIGDGPDRGALEALAKKLGVAAQVTFAGRLGHEELPARLAAASALVHASESEGLANVWVEALACETPVVTTDVGGAAEVVNPRVGRLIGVKSSPFGIAKAVEATLAQSFASEDFAAAVEPFHWDRNLAQLRDIYRRATKK